MKTYIRCKQYKIQRQTIKQNEPPSKHRLESCISRSNNVVRRMVQCSSPVGYHSSKWDIAAASNSDALHNNRHHCECVRVLRGRFMKCHPKIRSLRYGMQYEDSFVMLIIFLLIFFFSIIGLSFNFIFSDYYCLTGSS